MNIRSLIAASMVLFGMMSSPAMARERVDPATFGKVNDIYFVGYCDGLHLISGPGDSIKGHRTGCMDDSIRGSEQEGRGVNVTVYVVRESAPVQFVLYNDHSFEVYVDGSWVNAGRWASGEPTERATLTSDLMEGATE